MLKKRILTALIGIPVIILAIWFDKPLPWLTALAAAGGLLGVVEFYRITGVSKFQPLLVFGAVWTLLFIILPHCTDGRSLPVLLTAGLTLSLAMLLFLKAKEDVFKNWAWMTSGALYVGWLLGLLVALRLEAGRNWVYLALFATFASDSAAYFIGKAIGRHKMAPRISPGKTWEGAVAGLVGGIIVGWLFTLDTPLQLPLSLFQAIVLGVVISVFGQVGDLAESLLKRNTGVKDSGTLMPGHGGLLDRTDSILFAGTAVYLFYILML